MIATILRILNLLFMVAVLVVSSARHRLTIAIFFFFAFEARNAVNFESLGNLSLDSLAIFSSSSIPPMPTRCPCKVQMFAPSTFKVERKIRLSIWSYKINISFLQASSFLFIHLFLTAHKFVQKTWMRGRDTGVQK